MEGGGRRPAAAKGRPGERFTPRDKSKKREQRDSKYGESKEPVCRPTFYPACLGGLGATRARSGGSMTPSMVSCF